MAEVLWWSHRDLQPIHVSADSDVITYPCYFEACGWQVPVWMISKSKACRSLGGYPCLGLMNVQMLCPSLIGFACRSRNQPVVKHTMSWRSVSRKSHILLALLMLSGGDGRVLLSRLMKVAVSKWTAYSL